MDGRMRRALAVSMVTLFAPAIASAQGSAPPCLPDNAGLKLPPGFCASIFADSIRGVRRFAVAPNGDVFAAVQGRASNAGVLVLRDANHTGRGDTREQFAGGFQSSELELFDGSLYVETAPPAPQRGQTPSGPPPTHAIVRFPLKAGELKPSGPADTIVEGIVATGNHTTRNFAITRDGILYMNIGSATNTCQDKDRVPRAPGANPCVEVETRAGVWKFDARKKNQTPSSANHFARGIRNAVGMAISPTDGKLWTTQHGRDDLASWFAQLGMDSVTAIKFNAENPAEELLQVNQGDDFGWPYCYYSFPERKLVQAPEYGGDGKKVGDCASKKAPVAVFPGHWAPNGLFFYTGSSFPAKYKNGAFIAFHGSWNRAPEPQAGYVVVFQPLKDNKAVGSYEVFADGFAPNVGVGRGAGATGAHRPTAVAQMPDGSLLIGDDAGGRIYRIYYTGK